MSGPRMILIVDPDSGSGRALSDLFAEEGYAALHAQTAGEALSVAQRHRVDMAIIEHELGDIPGAVLAIHLRARNPSVRVAFTDGWLRGRLAPAEREITARQRACGIYRYGEYPVFPKPLDPPSVLAWASEPHAQDGQASS